MKYCPKCRNEYREGIDVCPDCGETLLEGELTEEVLVPIYFGDEEQMNLLKDYLEYNNIMSGKVSHNEKDDVYELSVSQNDREQSMKLVSVFIRQEIERAEDEGEIDETDVEPVSPYIDNREKAADNRSSGWTLLFVGTVGLIFFILCMTGVINLSLGDSVLFYIVMIAFMIFMIVSGIISFINAKKLMGAAKTDSDLRSSILDFVEENLKAEDIDAKIDMTDNLNPEEKFFSRSALIKSAINEKFVNLDQGFLDSLIDETIYEKVFSD
ncbi:MAG: zf-TFIIB domain-containing protein [Acetatifactor sp.]|nr:zf-TFIIB domain-containing protein [Acetatifactor sp.]